MKLSGGGVPLRCQRTSHIGVGVFLKSAGFRGTSPTPSFNPISRSRRAPWAVDDDQIRVAGATAVTSPQRQQ
jgi:hypothetical protein